MTDFKEGDKVRVVFEGEWSGNGVRIGAMCKFRKDGVLEIAKSIELIERAGRPLEVGEDVFWPRVNGFSERVIKATYGHMAMVCNDIDYWACAPITELNRPCVTPITEAKS